MKVIDIKYLAGVLDSDGSFSICKRHVIRTSANYVSQISLSWKKEELTENFMKRLVHQFGGSYADISSHQKSRFPNASPTIKYCATGKVAYKICQDVYPYLELKQKQAKNLMNLCELIKPGKNRPQELTDKLEDLYFYNKSLNSKNGRNKYEDNRKR
jgi:hypothetical protein